jgi:dTDP-6-deoxy-L-talose 4-dehydrogenase (NAD+)
MKILVTGAGGFIGSAFARHALAGGHEIGGLLLPAEATPARVPANEHLTWLRGTLAEPPWPDVERFQPDACVHFAWIATPGVYLESRENEDYFRWSVDFVRRLRALGTNHLVGVGTCIEYQMTGQPLAEERTPVMPTTRYARCKNALRETLEADARRDGWRFCWGRVFYPYGVGEHPARLCSSLIQKLSRGEKIVLKTPDSTKDYIYIDDLAAAILLTVERQYTGTINWGTGEGVSVRELADTAAAMLCRPELVEAAPTGSSDPFDYVVADAARLRQLGWQPQHTLQDGLRKILPPTR